VGKVTNYFTNIKVAEIKMETHDLEVGDEIRIIGPTTGAYEGFVKEIRVDYKITDKTVKGESCSIPEKDFLRRSDKVYKVVDAER